jgi:hypothetical protein
MRVTAAPGADQVARIPSDDWGWVYRDGRVVGIMLCERKRRRRGKRAEPPAAGPPAA